MIIVSQRKDELVNFDRIESIWICADEEGRFTIEATADTNSTLGTYSTEERAKEVLEEICKFYEISKRYECNTNTMIFLEKSFEYKMPEG